MTYLKERKEVNSLFGTYTINVNETNVKFDNDDKFKTATYDFILRGKEGLQRRMIKADRTVEALANPIKFLGDKRQDLYNIANDLEDSFEKTYKRELQRGLSHEKTKQNVQEEIDKLAVKKLKMHNEDYPEDLVKRVIRKLTA